MVSGDISPAYIRAAFIAFVSQVLLLILLGLLLDGGRMLMIASSTWIAFWIGVAAIMIRRPRAPRETDLYFVRLGSIAMFVIAILLSMVLPR